MVLKPQKTKFQLKIVENIQTLSIWANNPWRRYSISLITILIGYFFGSSLGMVSAVVELMDPVAAFLSVVFIEFLIVLRRNFSCLLYTSPSPRDRTRSRMPSSA